MISILCKCGNAASLKTQDELYEIRCESCKRSVGPTSSFDEVYRKWYCLVPMKTASKDICDSMKVSIMSVSKGGRVPSDDILDDCPERNAGRRALNILLDCDLINATYVHKGEEVDFERAMEVKNSGGDVSVFFSKSFSSSKLE